MQSQRIETPDGISWHVETIGHNDKDGTGAENECIVLIPSGEGDCQSQRAVAEFLAHRGPYNILTFDTPGFSRTTAPPEAYARVTPHLLAKQIIGLLDVMHIAQATFFGCSSGGGATLALCALYPSRVKCGIVHEIPLDKVEALLDMLDMSDEEITALCRGLYANGIIEQDVNDGKAKWEALGHEYHFRLEKNYVTWVRGYVNAVEVGSQELASDPENLRQRPIFWTVGSLNPGAGTEEGIWKSNFNMARQAGLKVNNKVLRSLHFPSVTVPEDLAAWIEDCISKVT